MRTLYFTKDEETKYNLLYEAFAMSDRPMRAGDLRLCAKIYDKFELIGEFSEEKRGTRLYKLAKDGHVALEEPEFALLLDAFKQVPWTSQGARNAAPILDWLESIKEDVIAKKTPTLVE